jgi:hypothetical protein
MANKMVNVKFTDEGFNNITQDAFYEKYKQECEIDFICFCLESGRYVVSFLSDTAPSQHDMFLKWECGPYLMAVSGKVIIEEKKLKPLAPLDNQPMYEFKVGLTAGTVLDRRGIVLDEIRKFTSVKIKRAD